MLPELAQDLSVPIGQVVLLTSAYSLPFALMQVVFGPLSEALGKTRVLIFSLGAVCISMALMAVAPGFYSLVACRMLSGAFAGGIGPVTIALLSDRVAVGRRQHQLRRRRCFVRVVDAGEAGDLPRPSLGVEALGIPALAILQWRVDEDLEELDPGGLVHLTGQLAVLGRGDRITVAAAAGQDSNRPAMEVLLLGGKPIREPVFQYGPFVMNTKAEVIAAMEDFNAGRFGSIPANALRPHRVQG